MITFEQALTARYFHASCDDVPHYDAAAIVAGTRVGTYSIGGDVYRYLGRKLPHGGRYTGAAFGCATVTGPRGATPSMDR